jgi:hypothetical protein
LQATRQWSWQRSTTVAGVLGTAAPWVAPTGSRAAVSLELVLWEGAGGAQTPRLVEALERQARVFFGGGGHWSKLRGFAFGITSQGHKEKEKRPFKRQLQLATAASHRR